MRLQHRNDLLFSETASASFVRPFLVGRTLLQTGRICPGQVTGQKNFRVDVSNRNIDEAGKKRLAGDTARQATSGEVKDLRREMSDLKEVLAETLLENFILKKSLIGDGGETDVSVRNFDTQTNEISRI